MFRLFHTLKGSRYTTLVVSRSLVVVCLSVCRSTPAISCSPSPCLHPTSPSSFYSSGIRIFTSVRMKETLGLLVPQASNNESPLTKISFFYYDFDKVTTDAERNINNLLQNFINRINMNKIRINSSFSLQLARKYLHNALSKI